MIFRRDILKGLSAGIARLFWGPLGVPLGIAAGGALALADNEMKANPVGWWAEWNGFVIQIKEYYYNTSLSSYSNFMGGSLAIAGKLTTASGPVATMGDRMMDPGDGKLAFCLDGATVIRGKDTSPISVHIDMFEDEIHASFTFTVIP